MRNLGMPAAGTDNEETRGLIRGNTRALRYRVAIRFVVAGDVRFLSHRDMLRLYTRAVSRANLAIRFSGGFNPRARLWLPLPRSVGVASNDELLIIELDRPDPPDQVVRQLAGALPTGIELGEAFELACQAMPCPVEVTYRLDLAGETNPELAAAVRRMCSAERLEVRRPSKRGGPDRAIDLRAWIVRVDLTTDALTFSLHISVAGSARPAEVLVLLGLDPIEMLPRLRREAVQWEGIERAGHTDGPRALGGGDRTPDDPAGNELCRRKNLQSDGSQ